MEKIFVMIPSLLDISIINTVNECVNKAKYPDRITFGLSIQGLDHIDFSHIKNERRILYLENNIVYGIGKTRYFLQKLHNDEEYVLSIDCHTGFDIDWDEKLINEHKKLNNNKAVISQPLQDHFNNSCRKSKYKYNYRSQFAIEYDYINSANSEKIDGINLSQVISPHFIFATKDFINIQYPHKIIWTEEYLMSIKLFCNGFDIYELEKTFLTTLAKDKESNYKRNFWLFPSKEEYNLDKIKQSSHGTDYNIFSGQLDNIKYPYDNKEYSYHLLNMIKNNKDDLVSATTMGAASLILNGYSDILGEDIRNLQRGISEYYEFHSISKEQVYQCANRMHRM